MVANDPFGQFVLGLQSHSPELTRDDWQYACDVYAGKQPTVDGKPIHWANNEHLRGQQLKLVAMGHASRRRIVTGTALDQRVELLDYAKCKALGVGPMLQQCSFDRPDWQRTPLLQRVAEFLTDPRHHLLLLGPTGNGKTSAAVAWLARVCTGHATPQGLVYNGMLVKSRQISDNLGIDKEAKAYRQILETKRHLVIDDLKVGGEGTVSAAFVAYIDDLFDTRYRLYLPTVITSNATAQEIAKTYGDRLVSRFRQWGVVYASDGYDLRQQTLPI